MLCLNHITLVSDDGSALYAQTVRTFNSALAEGTYANRRRQAQTYLNFAVRYNVNYLAPTVLNVCMFSQYLANNHSAISSVKNYIAGAKTWVLQHNGDISSFLSYELGDMIKSLNKSSDHVTKRAYPLSLDDITLICMYLVSATNTPPAIKSCILTGFYAFLRSSNLVCNSANNWEGPHSLLARNVIVTERALIVIITSTKSRKKPYAVTLSRTQDQRFCLVHAWEVYYNNIKPFSAGPAYLMNDRSPVTSKILVSFMRAALLHVSHPHANSITMHSLRRGAVKDAQQAGASVKEIMDLGAWSSYSGIRPYLSN